MRVDQLPCPHVRGRPRRGASLRAPVPGGADYKVEAERYLADSLWLEGLERRRRARGAVGRVKETDVRDSCRAEGASVINRTLVVIPAFNEGGRVGNVVRGVLEPLPDADVLVVDDGSADATAAEAVAAGGRAISLPLNLGY